MSKFNVGDIVTLNGLENNEYIVFDILFTLNRYLLTEYRIDGKYVYSKEEGNVIYAYPIQMSLVEDFCGRKCNEDASPIEDYNYVENGETGIVKVILSEDIDDHCWFQVSNLGIAKGKEYYAYKTDNGVEITLDGLDILLENGEFIIIETTSEISARVRKLKNNGIFIKLIN